MTGYDSRSQSYCSVLKKSRPRFVATDDATKRIIVSVAGTGLPTDAGFIADVLADVNANNLYGLGCPVIQVQKTKFGLPYIVKLPGLHHRLGSEKINPWEMVVESLVLSRVVTQDL